MWRMAATLLVLLFSAGCANGSVRPVDSPGQTTAHAIGTQSACRLPVVVADSMQRREHGAPIHPDFSPIRTAGSPPQTRMACATTQIAIYGCLPECPHPIAPATY